MNVNTEAKKLGKRPERQARPNTESKIKYGTYSKRVEAAKRYAAADRSDPFAFNRAMAHMANGVAGFTQDGRDAFYDADETKEVRGLEKRNDNGELYIEEYTVPAYKNRVRP